MNKNELYKILHSKQSGNFNEIFLEFNNNPLRSIISDEIVEDIKNKIIKWNDDSSPILIDILMSKDDFISDNVVSSILSEVSNEIFLGYVIWKLEGSNKSEFLNKIIDIFNATDDSILKYQSVITIFFFDNADSKDFIKLLREDSYYIPEFDKTISEIVESIIIV